MALKCLLRFNSYLNESALRHADGCCSTSCRRYSKKLLLALKQQPSSSEVMQLNGRYPDPQELITRLLRPITEVDSSYVPKVHLQSHLNGSLWRANLQMLWPVPFHTTGICMDPNRAQHYAYLQACNMYQHFGFISTDGRIVECHDQLELFRSKLLSKFPTAAKLFNYSCHMEVTDEGSRWVCSLDVRWPYNVNTTGCGKTQTAAESVAAALAYFTLKNRKQLAVNSRSPKTLNVCRLPNSDQPLSSPDYEMWVDASQKGYGAYLVCQSGPDSGRPTRWLCNAWPNFNRLRHSTLAEFYAVVCAVYTWKKKFAGRSVLIWSDSEHAVRLIRNGIVIVAQQSAYAKLFETLYNTCWQYDIHISARHLNRCHNEAADSLSKLNMDRFHEIVPDAAPRAKKLKKLDFLGPLDHLESLGVKNIKSGPSPLDVTL